MAVTVNSNMAIYDDEYIASYVETLQQVTDVFNGGSNNGLRLITEARKGDFSTMGLFTDMVHVGRRDPNDVANKVASRLNMAEETSPKLYRSFMIDTTRQAFRSIQKDLGLFSAVAGEQVAKQQAAAWLNTAILYARASIGGVPTAVLNLGAGVAFDTNAIFDGRQLMGDQASRLACIVMHSKMATQLIKSQYADKQFNAAGATIVPASPETGNMPVVVTDSTALVDTTGATPRYIALMAVENGIRVEESEDQDVVTDVVTGQGNIIQRVQGEFAMNPGVTGMSYKKATGENPDDATLAVSTNYDQIRTDVKSLGAVMVTAEIA